MSNKKIGDYINSSLKKNGSNQKIIRSSSSSSYTEVLPEDLTQIPNITKDKNDSKVRSLVSQRRLEYAMGKKKIVKKPYVVNYALHLAKIIYIQRWFRGNRYPIKKVIFLQANIRGFLSRKHFTEEVRKVKLMKRKVIIMQRVLTKRIYLKIYFRTFKRMFQKRKILDKIIYLQYKLRKKLRNLKLTKKRKMLAQIIINKHINRQSALNKSINLWQQKHILLKKKFRRN